MHRPLLSLALGIVALGVLAATPGSAKAFPPTGVMGSRSANGCGSASVVGVPAARIQSSGYGMTKPLYSPAASRAAFTSRDVSRLWFGSSAVNFNAITVNTMRSRGASVMNSVFSPYSGFSSGNWSTFTNVSRGSGLGAFSDYIGSNSNSWLNMFRTTGAIFPISPEMYMAPGSHTLPGPWGQAYRAIAKFNIVIL
jgi:hypothetical protein